MRQSCAVTPTENMEGHNKRSTTQINSPSMQPAARQKNVLVHASGISVVVCTHVVEAKLWLWRAKQESNSDKLPVTQKNVRVLPKNPTIVENTSVCIKIAALGSQARQITLKIRIRSHVETVASFFENTSRRLTHPVTTVDP